MPSAGGTIGVAEVKRAPPDGYTILCTISSSLIQNRVTVKDLPYDPEKDFTYLAMTTSLGGPVVAAEKTGATNLKEFVEYARKVDKLNWGAYGPGSTPHVLIETMVNTGRLDWPTLVERMSFAPAKLTRSTTQGRPVAVGEPANLVLVDASARAVVDRENSASKSRNNPYHARDLPDPVVTTIWAGRVTHRR